MRSKSLSQPVAGFSHCLSLKPTSPSRGRNVLAVGITMLAALSSVMTANAQGVKLDPTIITYAGNGSLTNTFSGDGGQATAAGLNNPEGIAYDNKGNTYLADYGNNRIRVVSSTGIINTVFGTGAACPVGAGNACGDGGAASAATFNTPSAMQFDTNGDLYIADFGDNRIRKITATNGTITGASIITTVAGTGAAGATGNTGLATAATLYNPHGLTLDRAGDLWIANQGQGTSCTVEYVPAANGTVQIGGVATAVTAGHIYLVAGQLGTCGYISDANGTTYGTASRLTSPTNIALDAAGNVYIGDYGNGRVRKLNMTTGVITTIAGTAYQACAVVAPNAAAPNPVPACGDGGLATAAALNGPTGVYVDGANNVIIGDAFGARVREISGATGIISTISGDSQQCTNITQTVTNALYPGCGDGGAATKALVSFPILISVNPQGNILYVDQYDNKIREILEHIVFPPTNVGASSAVQNVNLITTGTGNTTITSITGSSQFTLGTVTGCVVGGGNNAPGTICTIPVTFTPQYPGQQFAPLTVVTNGGTFTFGLTGTGVAPQAILLPGVLSTVAGTGAVGATGNGGAATAATFNGSREITFDSAGNYYIGDLFNNEIREVTVPGGIISVVAGGGATNYITTTGTLATAAALNQPQIAVFDAAGNFYIPDIGNSVVAKVDAVTKKISVVAGNGTVGTGGDGGLATSAQLDAPAMLAVNPSTGDFYVGDTTAHTIRFVNAASGIITTVAGTAGTACATPTAACGDGGLATAALLTRADGMWLDASGNLLFSDRFDFRVRKINTTTGIITTVAGNGVSATTGDGGPATSASLSSPWELWEDPAGDLYIADGNASIRMVSASTGNISTVVGNGTPCTTIPSPACGDGGPANVSALSQPTGVALDKAGNMYVVEYGAAAGGGPYRVRMATTNPVLLPFPTVPVGTSAGTLTASLENIGNATLTYTTPAGTASNALVTTTGPAGGGTSTAFSQTNATTCGPIFSTTTGNNTLVSGATCNYVVNFTPDTIAGNYTGTLVETDNSLYSGTGNTLYPTPLTQTVNLTGKATLGTPTGVLTYSPAAPGYGTPVTLTETLTPPGTGAVPTGTVQFSQNGVNIGTPVTVVNGVATITTSNLPVGSDPVQAVFTPSTNNYNPVTSTNTVPVTKAPITQPPGGTPVLSQSFTATTNPATNPTTATAGTTPVILTYTIPVAAGNTAPTGPVVFTNGATTLGTCTTFVAGTPVAAAGAAPAYTPYSCAISTTALPVGNPDTVTATYTTTDPNYAGGAPALTAPVIVNAAAGAAVLTAAPNPATIGQQVVLTETVGPIGGVCPTGPVTFLNNGVSIGTGAIALTGGSCVATLPTSSLPLGSNPITATIPASGPFAATTSGPVNVVVNKIPGTGDTLTTAPNPSTFGQAVTITETIPTVNGLTPTGTVTFYYPSGTAIGTGTVSGGVATLTTSALPVGTDPITAIYGGDTNYATVTSGPVNQVVNAATAGATLAAGPNPATFGTPVTITETLVPVNGQCPPGPVSFFSNGTLIGTGTLNASCVATITTSTLPVGSDAITATAPAGGSFGPTTSGPVALVINKANGPDTLASTPNPSTFGQNVTITDTIPTVGGVAPTGTVNFYDFGVLIGTGTVTGGVATLQTTTLPVGTDSLTAIYQGDGNYAVVTAGPVNQVVSAVSSTATLAVGPNPTTFGTAVTMTETIPVVNGTPATGTVTFSQNGITIGTGTINASGVATFTTTTLPVGTDPITATYPGNSNYNPVNSGPVNEVINKANGPDTLAASPDPAVFGTTVTITDTVPTVGGVAPTGTVTFYNNGTAIGTAPIVNGVATLTTTTLPVGSDPITAIYGGDGNYATVTTGPVNEIITTGNTSPVLSATPNPSTFGTPVTITESIPGINGVAPTGTVTFYYPTGTAIGTGTVTNGVATLVTSTLPIGTDPVTAIYSGDKNYSTATTGPLNVVVNKAAPTDTVVGAPNPASAGTSVTFTFTVPLVNGVAPTGVVTFYNGTTAIGTGTVNASGIATLATTTLPVGTNTITAKYPGDNTYSPASPTTTETINAVSGGDTVTVNPSPTTFGNPTVITFCIPVVTGAPVPTGTVTFTAGGVILNTTPITIGTTPVNGCYIATTTTTNLPVGSPTTVTGTYTPGPASGYGPGAPTATVVVAPVNPTSVIGYSPTTPSCGSTLVTLTDTINPVNGVVPTGTVQFYAIVNGVPQALGTPQTVVNGVATLIIALPCGTTGIYGVFTGNSPYGTSTTPTVPLSLADFTIAATPATATVNPGDTAVYTVNLAGAGGVAFTSPVTLTASGLPPGATVKFGTTTYVPGVGPTPTTMTIVTSPTFALLQQPVHGGNGIYYGLLLPLLGIRRIRKKIRSLPRGISYCLAGLLLLAGLGAMTGCSGGYFGAGPKAFVITVTGTSGTLTHSTTVTLTIE